MDSEDREAWIETLYEHLAATEELAIDPTANRWLGEAQALATDVHENDLAPAVVSERAANVVHLLESSGDTGNETADEHVATALEAARRLAEE